MKKSIALSVLAAFSVLAGGHASAAIVTTVQPIPERLEIQGQLTYQLPDTMNSDNTRFILRTKTVVFNTRSIISSLNSSTVFTTAAGGQIPNGSYFIYIGDSLNHTVLVTNKNGYVRNLTTLTDGVNPFATFTLTGNEVSRGQASVSTPESAGTDEAATSTLTIQNGAGTSITISGLQVEHFIIGKDSAGLTPVTTSGELIGFGPGSYQGSTGVVRGHATLQGRGKVSTINPT